MARNREHDMDNDKYYCIRRCYHFNGAPEGHVYRTYEIGDRLAPGAPTNRHFTLGGVMPEKDGAVPISNMADDPRPTKQMIKELEEKFGVKMKSTAVRKIVFQKLFEKEEEERDKVAEKAEAEKKKAEVEAEAETTKTKK